jgi:hypothetical protein
MGGSLPSILNRTAPPVSNIVFSQALIRTTEHPRLNPHSTRWAHRLRDHLLLHEDAFLEMGSPARNGKRTLRVVARERVLRCPS